MRFPVLNDTIRQDTDRLMGYGFLMSWQCCLSLLFSHKTQAGERDEAGDLGLAIQREWMTRHLGPVLRLAVTNVSRFMWLMLEVNVNNIEKVGRANSAAIANPSSRNAHGPKSPMRFSAIVLVRVAIFPWRFGCQSSWLTDVVFTWRAADRRSALRKTTDWQRHPCTERRKQTGSSGNRGGYGFETCWIDLEGKLQNKVVALRMRLCNLMRIEGWYGSGERCLNRVVANTCFSFREQTRPSSGGGYDAHHMGSCGHRAFEVGWGPAGRDRCCNRSPWQPSAAGPEPMACRSSSCPPSYWTSPLEREQKMMIKLRWKSHHTSGHSHGRDDWLHSSSSLNDCT